MKNGGLLPPVREKGEENERIKENMVNHTMPLPSWLHILKC